MNKLTKITFFLLVISILVACAKQSAPTGGPKDTTPPKFIKANPDTLSTNVNINLKEAIINFDEYLVLKDYSKNVVISPSFKTQPIVTPQAMGKKFISIKFKEPLTPNTTYSFNFGDAVQDLNENNILSNFHYVFSTGEFIDSLQIKGKVYSNYDFFIPKKILIGLYKIDSTYNDSIIIKQKPYYITRADNNGEYTLKYLASGNYKLISFEDKVENVLYDLGKEQFAYHSDPIDLKSNQNYDLILFNQKSMYRKPEASSKQEGLIIFNVEGANTDSIKISSMSKEFKTAYVQKFPKQDSINFWFNPSIDSISGKSSKIKFVVQNRDKIDTISTIITKTDENNKKILELSSPDKKDLAPNKDFKIRSSTPIVKLDSTKIKIFKDSVAIPYRASIDSINAQTINFSFDKNLSEKFKIDIYPNGITDVLGKKNDTISFSVSTGKETDFGNIKLTIKNPPKKPFILQLIKKDKNYTILEESYHKANTNLFKFNYIRPDEYLFRLLVDENENGIWDSGDFFSNKQPEPTFLYPEPIKTRAMWEIDEIWVLGKPNQAVIFADEKNDKDKKNTDRDNGVNQIKINNTSPVNTNFNEAQ